MLIEDVRNPSYNWRGTIDVEVLVSGEWLPFTADPNDRAPHGRQLYQELTDGVWGPVAAGPTETEILQRKRSHASMSKADFMVALHNAGMLQAAKDAVISSNATEEFRIYWEHNAAITRTSPLVAFLMTELEITDTQADNFFGIT